MTDRELLIKLIGESRVKYDDSSAELMSSEYMADYIMRNGFVYQRRGKWIPYLDGDFIMPERYYQCSVCGRRGYKWKENYCNCGAKNT